MIFSQPIEFEEAIKSRAVKALFPNNLSYAELQKIDAAIRERALFSAKVANAQLLQEIDRVVRSIINPQEEKRGRYRIQVGDKEISARDAIRAMLDKIKYKPEKGKEGTIEDLSSNQRIGLIIHTQTQLAQGYGEWQHGQDPEVLTLWPCVELRRVYPRVEPRGTDEGYPDEYWQKKWEDIGGTLYDGRMICRKDDPIRAEISEFGLPYGPPGFNSGYDWADIRRDVAEKLGVISKNERAVPQTRGFEEDIAASVDNLSDELRDELIDELGDDFTYTDETGTLSGGDGRVADYGNQAAPQDSAAGWFANVVTRVKRALRLARPSPMRAELDEFLANWSRNVEAHIERNMANQLDRTTVREQTPPELPKDKTVTVEGIDPGSGEVVQVDMPAKEAGDWLNNRIATIQKLQALVGKP